MRKLTVNTNSAAYPIYIDDSFDSLAQAVSEAGLAGRRTLVVSDSNTSRLFADEIAGRTSASVFVVEAGESSKSIEAACEIYRRCIDLGLDRESVIIALGGGVVGDLAGFAAATYMRGTAFVQIPTTLLAQVDSSVGGKVAVNLGGLKNIVGAFYQPRLVFSNIRTLGSLPWEEFLSGLAEAVKHGLIYGRDYLNYIVRNKEGIKSLSLEALTGLVGGSCEIKADIVRQDERERNIREILNLGHTFGHAIESVCGFNIPHGHAVAVGCLAALAISRDKGFVSAADCELVHGLYEYFGLPMRISKYPAAEILKHMKHDKKSKNGVMTVVLLRELGRAYSDNTLGEHDIIKGLAHISGYYGDI